MYQWLQLKVELANGHVAHRLVRGKEVRLTLDPSDGIWMHF